MRMRRILPLLVLSLAAGCQQGAAPLSPADQQAVRTAVDSFTQRVKRADWPGAVALYSADVHFMPPNQPAVEGRDALLAWMRAFPPLGSFNLTVDEVSGEGNVAYVRGHYSMTFTPPGAKAPVSDAGKFLEVHRRAADGTWPNVADMFNSDKPPAH